MNEMITICGISFPKSQLVADIEEKFESIYEEDECAFFVSKEEFTHDEEDFSFKYHYVIEINMDEEDKFYYTLALVPTYESLCKECKNEVSEDYEGTDIYDVCSYGYSVDFMTETSKGEEWDDEIVRKLASVFESTDRLRGFYLDKRVNMIGTTGWDMLDSFINGNDWVKATMAKYAE